MGFKLLVFGYIVSMILVFVGIIAVVFSGPFIHSFVSSNIRLDPSTDLYKQWLAPPIEVHLNFYLFDLKNGADFENGAKPAFEQIGPFVYKELITKEDIVDNLNFTLTYKERRSYSFIPELSVYPEDYPIRTLSMAPITLISQLRYQKDYVQLLADALLKVEQETLLVNKTVREILFGYKDPLLVFLHKLAPKLVPSEYVGFFVGKNDTVDGLYVVYTGNDEETKVGRIQRFNTMDTLDIWATKYANMINGTDGTLNAPFVDESTVLYIFESDLCRSLYANYNRTYSTLDNIKLLGFSPHEYFFANSTVNPDNAGFCTPPGNCLQAGLLNLTLCVGNVPIIQSCPHFLYADPSLLQDVIGLSPDYNAHQTMIYIEPLTGVPMKANKRIQFNTKLFRNPHFNITQKIPEVLFPLFWVDENFEIDQKNADQFYYQVQLPLTLLNVAKYVILGIGGLLLLISGGFSVRMWRRNRQAQQATSNADSIQSDERSPLIS